MKLFPTLVVGVFLASLALHAAEPVTNFICRVEGGPIWLDHGRATGQQGYHVCAW
ncbi:hypothetical protein [Prosthecobacter sp.]|uniref:hypothetical protein n=1 Tax=Prosthecobacter sp. TaxID=1965333 RepID=UPI0037CABF0A